MKKNPFKPLKKVKEKELKGELELSPALEDIIKGCMDFIKSDISDAISDLYGIAQKCIKKHCKYHSYTSDDILGLCYELENISKSFRDKGPAQHCGIYLTALANNIADSGKEIVLDIPDMIVQPDALGCFMDKGKLTIYGNVGYALGHGMKGGVIDMKGDTDGLVGIYMENGQIYINGDAGKEVGLLMKEGEIHLNGSYESLSSGREGGRIFFKKCEIFS